MKKVTKKSLRLKADRILQDYIRAKYKNELCWVCGENLVVCGHHFFPVSNSNATRYYLPNIIPICRDCHSRVHTQPHLVQPIICFKLGKEWMEDLLETKKHGAKYTLSWIKDRAEEMEELLKGIENGTSR